MADNEESRNETLRTMVHDIQNSLHAIGMGIVMLRDSGNVDHDKLICDSMETERANASRLVAEVFKLALDKQQ